MHVFLACASICTQKWWKVKNRNNSMRSLQETQLTQWVWQTSCPGSFHTPFCFLTLDWLFKDTYRGSACL